jgi:hypothetical protein
VIRAQQDFFSRGGSTRERSAPAAGLVPGSLGLTAYSRSRGDCRGARVEKEFCQKSAPARPLLTRPAASLVGDRSQAANVRVAGRTV